MSAARWTEANQTRVLAGMAELRARLVAHANGNGHEDIERAAAAEAAALAAMPAPAALDRIVTTFGLSPFERRLLLLTAAVELDSAFARLCADAHGDATRGWVTFGLALAVLPDAHWSALAPTAPLRRWRMIDVAPGDALVSGALRIDERVLHHIAGVRTIDDRLLPLARPVARVPLAPSHATLAERAIAAWNAREDGDAPPVLMLCGVDAGGCRAVGVEACARLGTTLYRVAAADLPATVAERDVLRCLWERETALEGVVLLIDAHGADRDALRNAATFAETLQAPVLLSARDPLPLRHRTRLRIDVDPPAPEEQAALWRSALGESAASLDGHIELVVGHFRVGVDGIRSATTQVRAALLEHTDPARALWDACRIQARPGLDDLAQRIEPAATWHDLVLPTAQIEILKGIAASVANRTTVYERWGFAARGNRGLGVSAVFAGASGTGKTMAAEVLAGALALDLYRIDLSQVVSKYIGETEKNLARVFDAAEEGGAVLLFDEADALFGKRTEVRDSHDRYANVEVSYLLQRMEAYRGLAILTTNMKRAIDPAFLRRIRFVVEFPFPDHSLRAEIWRRVFPAATPTEGLERDRLARLNIAGGNIRNIAINAAFLAAAAGSPVRMQHILRAARAEYAKLEKPLTDAEVAGWV